MSDSTLDSPPLMMVDKPVLKVMPFDNLAKPKLEAAILIAQAEIKGVGKESRNEYAKYNYASSDQILAASRAAFLKAGLSFRMETFSIKPGQTTWVEAVFVIVHAESMERLIAPYSWPLVTQEKKPFDKILGGALTTATRYFLRGFLSIPQIEAEEMHARPDNRDDSSPDDPPPPEQPDQNDLATKEQFQMIGHLIRTTGAVPAAIEASFGPSEGLTVEAANRVIQYLNNLKGKGGKK